MRVLVDEAMPVQVIPSLRLNRRHQFDHVDDLGWIQQGRSAQGVRGMAIAIASVVVAMPYVLGDLQAADGQRIVVLTLLSATRRHEVLDPRVEVSRFPYWH